MAQAEEGDLAQVVRERVDVETVERLELGVCGSARAHEIGVVGIRESVRHGETGYLVPHGDAPAMAAAMTRIAGDADLVARLGAQARIFAETFTWERAANETAAHLYRVLASRSPR